jgi:urease accessory protein
MHRKAAWLLMGLAAAPGWASAHAGVDLGAHHGGFVQGLVHPLSGVDHLIAMTAVGLWAALRGGAMRVVAPLSFVAAMFIGALCTAMGLALPAVEPMVAASLLTLGLLVCRPSALPGGVALAVIAAFACFHGAAHVRELGWSAATAGMLVGTALLHAGGLVLGRLLRQRSAAWPLALGSGAMVTGTALLLG